MKMELAFSFGVRVLKSDSGGSCGGFEGRQAGIQRK